MFDISIMVYKFLDTSVYCVGRETDLNLLQQYFEKPSFLALTLKNRAPLLWHGDPTGSLPKMACF